MMKRYFLLLLSFLASAIGISQNLFPLPATDGRKLFDSVAQIRKEGLYEMYETRTGTTSNFINGRDYVPYYMRSRFKPILRPGEKRLSSIVFNGRRYDGLELQYDTFKDQVIYTNDTLIYNSIPYMVSINRDYIERFDLYFPQDTMTFRYLRGNDDPSFNLKEGFYEVVYSNKCTCLIKYTSSCSSMNGVFEYYQAKTTYVKAGSQFSRVTSQRQFIRLFGEKSDQVRHFMQVNSIKLRKAGRKELAGILSFYEHL